MKKTIVRTQLVVRFKVGKLVLVEVLKSKRTKPESYLPEIEKAWRENVTQSSRITLLGFGANDLAGTIPDANGDGAKFVAKLDH